MFDFYSEGLHNNNIWLVFRKCEEHEGGYKLQVMMKYLHAGMTSLFYLLSRLRILMLVQKKTLNLEIFITKIN